MRAAGFAMLDSLSADFSNGGLYQKFFESEAGPGLGVWLEARVQINPGVLAAAVFWARKLLAGLQLSRASALLQVGIKSI